jgi:predicted DNA-binding antitoxin AbrB/MazE fold protein
MTRKIPAVFENGLFRPLEKVPLREHTPVVIEIEMPKAHSSNAARKRRALAVAGRFHSKVGDLAENHDRYLTEESK